MVLIRAFVGGHVALKSFFLSYFLFYTRVYSSFVAHFVFCLLLYESVYIGSSRGCTFRVLSTVRVRVVFVGVGSTISYHSRSYIRAWVMYHVA